MPIAELIQAVSSRRASIEALAAAEREAKRRQLREERLEEARQVLQEARLPLTHLEGCAYARGLVTGAGCRCRSVVEQHNAPIDALLSTWPK